MAIVQKHIYLRDTRDRLVDLLGLGETYPLRDLPIDVHRLIVPEGVGAKIPVDASQRDCTYALYERETETLAQRVENGSQVDASMPGTGETILMDSPAIMAPIVYRVRSTRDTTAHWVYLHELAEVKTGIDTAVKARVVSGDWLIADATTHADDDPRLVDHGTNVVVELRDTQVGVLYRLVRDTGGGVYETLSEADIPGNFGTITLVTTSLIVDAFLRVQVIDPLAPAEPPQTLDGLLPVYIRPRMDTNVNISGSWSNVIDYNTGGTRVNIAYTQTGVSYTLFGRRLEATDFLTQAATDGTSIDVKPDGSSDTFIVKRPMHTPAWTEPEGFVPASNTSSGNETSRKIAPYPLTDDVLILVRARKTITLPDGVTQYTIDVPMQDAVVIFVRPNELQELRYQVLMAGDTTSGAVRIQDGQPGVFYHLQEALGGADLGKPGYVHERYGANPEVNVGIGWVHVGGDLAVGRDASTDLVVPELRGVEEMAIEVDLAVGDEPPAQAPLTAAQRATALPEVPIVDTPPLAIGAGLYGFAQKGRTRLTKPLTHSVTVFAPPLITAQKSATEGSIDVVVEASVVGDTYSLLVNGTAVGDAQAGNGANLTFTAAEPPPDEGTILDVSIVRGAAPAIVLEEIVRVHEVTAQSAAN